MDEGREMHASANGWKEHEKAATYPIVEGDEKEEKDGGWKGNVEDADAGEVSVDELVNQTGFGPYQRKLLILCGCGWAADIMDLQVCLRACVRVCVRAC